MTDFDDQGDIQRRSFDARFGIVALNLLTPGLGLLRLNRTGLAAAFIVVQILGAGLIGLRFASGPVFTFATWATIIAIGVTAIIALYGGSIVMTWRASRLVETRSGWIWRWYGLVLVWLIMVILTAPDNNFRKYYRTFSIPSESMLPVMRVNDLFLAQMHLTTPLQLGDLVLVHKAGVDYVKRIVAIPGDQVSMVAGQIVLNRQPVGQRKIGSTRVSYNGGVQSATVYEEQLPGEARPHQIVDILPTPQDNWDGVSLGANQYVMLGDNRDNALDSRFPEFAGGLGIVTRDQIVGKALFRFWRTGVGFANGAL